MKRWILGALLALLCVCAWGCSGDDSKRIATASDNISIGIKATVQAEQAIAKEGLITPAEDLAITKTLADVLYVKLEFDSQAQTLGTLDASNKAQLFKTARRLVASVNRLNDEMTHIKDEGARARLRAVLVGIDAGIAVLESVLGGVQ